MVLVGGAVVFALLWYAVDPASRWRHAPGHVVQGDLRYVHRNAETDLPKVTVRYEYTVGGLNHHGAWTGHWPTANSPNALAEQDLPLLQQKGYPLVVLYDPSHPAKSRLHTPPSGRALAFSVLAAVFAVLAAVYLIRVYPRIRHLRG